MKKRNLLKSLFVKNGLALKEKDLKKIFSLENGRELIFFVYTSHSGEKICLGYTCEARKKRNIPLTMEKVFEKWGEDIPSEFSISLIKNHSPP